jgi:PadR family transcriptional regulator PadR
MYGYEMVKLVNARSNRALEWKEGTLYPTLHRLEADGLVESFWQDAPAETKGARQRKYYAITPKGRHELARRLAEWQDFTGAVNAVLRGC